MPRDREAGEPGQHTTVTAANPRLQDVTNQWPREERSTEVETEAKVEPKRSSEIIAPSTVAVEEMAMRLGNYSSEQ